MVRIYRPPNPDPTDERFAVDHGIGLIDFNDRGATWTEPQVPEGWVEMVPGEAPWVPLDRPVGNPGTHRTHCCAKHGCKYGSPGCPVVSGELVQDYPCEVCGDDEDDEEGPHI
jgi:hypothetical protein